MPCRPWTKLTSLLAEYGYDAEPSAGGESLIPIMAFGWRSRRVDRPELRRRSGLLRPAADGGSYIGAMTRQSQVNTARMWHVSASARRDHGPHRRPSDPRPGYFGRFHRSRRPGRRTAPPSLALAGNIHAKSRGAGRWIGPMSVSWAVHHGPGTGPERSRRRSSSSSVAHQPAGGAGSVAAAWQLLPRWALLFWSAPDASWHVCSCWAFSRRQRRAPAPRTAGRRKALEASEIDPRRHRRGRPARGGDEGTIDPPADTPHATAASRRHYSGRSLRGALAHRLQTSRQPSQRMGKRSHQRHDPRLCRQGQRRGYRAPAEAEAPAQRFLAPRTGPAGTHVGGEHGVCGACTILFDGAPVRSCPMFPVQAHGQEINDRGGPGARRPDQSIRANWCGEPDGVQCGFCTPGFLMSLASASWNGRSLPTEAEIREAIRATSAAAPAIRRSWKRCK